MKLAELHWPEVEKLDRKQIVVLVPVGSMEQHGPHLPFQVDVFVSSRLAEDLDQKIPDVLLVFRRTIWIFRAPSLCAPESSSTFYMTSAVRYIIMAFAGSCC